ncbi:hypothetical protein F4680DRAFT_270713 [Xylaria scruposa]|nr:hypothetical protein F4680DRAFT_270713 [Xylaria scruposa]
MTFIPGRRIVPSKLREMLEARFGNNYSVEMRQNNYTIKAPSRISDDDIRKCY